MDLLFAHINTLNLRTLKYKYFYIIFVNRMLGETSIVFRKTTINEMEIDKYIKVYNNRMYRNQYLKKPNKIFRIKIYLDFDYKEF